MSSRGKESRIARPTLRLARRLRLTAAIMRTHPRPRCSVLGLAVAVLSRFPFRRRISAASGEPAEQVPQAEEKYTHTLAGLHGDCGPFFVGLVSTYDEQFAAFRDTCPCHDDDDLG